MVRSSLVSTPRIPPNLFGIPFGVAGLGNVWLLAAGQHHAPRAISTVIFAVAALAWLLIAVLYLAGGRAAVRHDLTDNITSPFPALALITPMLLSAQAIFPYAETPGRVLVDVFLVLTVLYGGWITGQWIYGPVELDKIHPGWFLPTVAGGLIAAFSAATVGQPRLGWTMLGLGTICWLVLGSIVLGRLLVRPALPAPLLPTLAIEVAPAAVASLAWFRLHGTAVDPVAAFLGGYGLLMVIAQIRLLPAYVKLAFLPSTWSFTFSWAAVATAGLVWLEVLEPAGYRAWEWVVLAAITLLIGAIAGRTVVALARRRFLPVRVS